MLIGFATPQLRAATHPVPLEMPPNGTKCLECHENRAKGKAVHSALASGGPSCHEVRVNKDVTRVKLTTTTPLSLCLTCHADKKAADIKGNIHSPAVRDCLKCHDPHTSDNKFQLLKATSGETKNENLCLTCHDTGVNVPKGGSRHAALDMGCETCHVTHKAGDRTQPEFAYHLTKGTPGLCLDCHDAKDEALLKAHQNQPFAKADCIECHDPHQSAAPKLAQRFLHPPFAEKSCDVCHAPAKDGKVVLTADNVKSVCVACHEEQAKKIQTAKVQHPGAQGDCTDCHDPHAGKSPGFPKPNAVAVCLTCHSDQADQSKKAHLHQPAFEQGCATCHDPHGDDNPKLLRVSNTNALCLECHGPDAEGKRVETAHLTTIFDGKVRLPESYFNKVPRLPLRYGLGHPTQFHPVADVPNPKTKGTIAMNCLTCHQPHAGNEAGMLVKDQKNNMNFCKTCHANGLNLSDIRVGGN